MKGSCCTLNKLNTISSLLCLLWLIETVEMNDLVGKKNIANFTEYRGVINRNVEMRCYSNHESCVLSYPKHF